MSHELRQPDQPSDWNVSWEASSLSLLKATLAATPAERLAWLEEAILIAYEAGALTLHGGTIEAGDVASHPRKEILSRPVEGD